MTKNTLTFELGGRVELADFADGMAAFRHLVNALTPRDAGVAWVVEDLRPGNAGVTLRGDSDDPGAVARIVDDYAKIGAALSLREDLPQLDRKTKATIDSIKALTGTADYVRFETPDSDYTIYRKDNAPSQPGPRLSLGAITGTIQAASNRGSLRFNLYERLFHKAVACYLAPGQEELLRNAWGRRAVVSGKISRDPARGLPIAIRNIMDVKILPEVEPDSYRKARGAVPRPPGAPLAEEAIRRLRDA